MKNKNTHKSGGARVSKDINLLTDRHLWEKKLIEIVVMGGVVVDVNNLPKDYVYKIIDLDEQNE